VAAVILLITTCSQMSNYKKSKSQTLCIPGKLSTNDPNICLACSSNAKCKAATGKPPLCCDLNVNGGTCVPCW
jgi:hypothetical protein